MPEPLTWTKDSITLTVNSDLLVSAGFQLRVIVTREVTEEEIKDHDPITFLRDLKRVEANALIETGAGTSTLRPDMASNLGLTIIAKKSIQGLDGVPHVASVSTATIWLPNMHRENVPLTWAAGSGVDVLLGRDFLKGFTISYDGANGTATLAVRHKD